MRRAENLQLVFHNTQLKKFFRESLMYSTHVKFTFFGKNICETPTISNINECHINDLKDQSAFKVIFSDGGKLLVYGETYLKDWKNLTCKFEPFNSYYNEALILRCFDGKYRLLGAFRTLGTEIVEVGDVFPLLADNNFNDLMKINDNAAKLALLRIKDDGIIELMNFSADEHLKYMYAARLAGINVALLILQDILKRDFRCKITSRNHYSINEQRVFVHQKNIAFDLDETLVFNGLPNSLLIEFLFMCAEKGKCIELITRNPNNIDKILRDIGLTKSTFQRIIQVKDNELKSAFIKDDTLFIDNEFPQREDVFENSTASAVDLDIVQHLEFIN